MIALALYGLFSSWQAVNNFKRQRKWHDYWSAKVKEIEAHLPSDDIRLFSFDPAKKIGGVLKSTTFAMMAESLAWLSGVFIPLTFTRLFGVF